MTLGRFHHQSGIALGPILFIVAIIAVLAAVIAAGSGAFNANTGTESAKAMAEVLIQSCDDYTRALQYMEMNNGCDPTAIDWTPPGFPTGATYTSGDLTGGNGTNRAGNGQCAMFDPRGGGMTFKPIPAAAMASPHSGLYTSSLDSGVNEDAFAGYPFFIGPIVCLVYQGQCAYLTSSGNNNSAIILAYNYVNQNVCQQVDNIANDVCTKVSGVTGTNSCTGAIANPTTYGVMGGATTYGDGIFAGRPLYTNGYFLLDGEPILEGPGPTSWVVGPTQGCGYDGQSNSNSAFIYSCLMQAR